MAHKQTPNRQTAEEVVSDDTHDAQEEAATLALPLASAKNISRPATALAAPPKGEVGKLTVSIINAGSNSDEGDAVPRTVEPNGRTPLVAVIELLLARHGGSLRLSELADLVGKHWNRPFPTSPYTNEEFIYVVVSSSDRVRVS